MIARHRAFLIRAFARPVALLTTLLLLAACAPFQRETPSFPGPAPVPATDDPGRALLLAAESRIGAPYRYGGSGPDAFDCSGLVAYVHRQIGLSVPRTAAEQHQRATPVELDELRPGDLVFFRLAGREVGHVGIYAGDDRFVHAPQSGGHVRIASLQDEWYRRRFVGAGRFYPAPP